MEINEERHGAVEELANTHRSSHQCRRHRRRYLLCRRRRRRRCPYGDANKTSRVFVGIQDLVLELRRNRDELSN